MPARRSAVTPRCHPEHGHGAIWPGQSVGDAEESGRTEQPDPRASADDALGPVNIQPGIRDKRAKIAVGDHPAGPGVIQGLRAVRPVLDDLGEQAHARFRHLTHRASVILHARYSWLESVS